MKAHQTQLQVIVHLSGLSHQLIKDQAHQQHCQKKMLNGYMQTGGGMKLMLLILKA